jgi:hypothetical protein
MLVYFFVRNSNSHVWQAIGNPIDSVNYTVKRPINFRKITVHRPNDSENGNGAESSHGKDLTMRRPDPSAPQGPMQVSEPAAADVGGGDRFDSTENRAIGRAYLEHLYRLYKTWPDAIAAYNWGMGNVDSWVKAGRLQANS